MENLPLEGEERKRILLEQARGLIYGLERISADSVWAHRSSGYRGSLLRLVDSLEGQTASETQDRDLDRLEGLLEAGYQVLIRAAREIRAEE
jgi:hypothetical protein